MNVILKPVKIHNNYYGKCGIYKENEIDVPNIPVYTLDETYNTPSKEEDWKEIHRTADDNTKQIADEIINTTEETKNNIDINTLINSIMIVDSVLIYENIDWNKYDNGIDNTKNVMEKILNDTGKKMIKTLPNEYQKDFKFDTASERALKWIDKQGARLVKEVGEETKKAIRAEIRKAIKEGLGADRTANNLINLIGLTRQQASAVTNLRKRMELDGINQTRIDRETKKYAKRLLEYRAQNIARTESMTSANQGYIEMVKQGIGKNIIPKNVQKEWIVTPDDRLCPYCKSIDGQIKNMNEDFTSSKGNLERPPLHPSCRCVIGLVFQE